MTTSIYGHVTVEQIREKNKIKKKTITRMDFFIIIVIADYIVLLDTICNRI